MNAVELISLPDPVDVLWTIRSAIRSACAVSAPPTVESKGVTTDGRNEKTKAIASRKTPIPMAKSCVVWPRRFSEIEIVRGRWEFPRR
ncbi:hypothetical protein C489_03731 [Natrinema versiforme JCM 10478]|uniref:Uncharacterized protein n=1 Tax=Natrinema versiforme JCM 10478 TaxID=1227496 RepID=L9Y8M8_9EURY|nr:hypothetical protein C489_03731 [Natrinema versiforme JCM 10478]